MTQSSAVDAVVIGASAGAVEALSVLLPALPASFPVPLMIVVHLPADRASLLVDIMRGRCALEVVEAEHTMAIKPGRIYIAPADYHLLVEKNGCLSLSADEPVHYSRPSIDVLFESAADAYENRLIGVVLTGANADGAAGLGAICAAGGTALVQDPAGAVARAMPEAAMRACPAASVLSLGEIAARLARL